MDMNLPFIIGRTAPVDISVAHFRLEGRGVPEFQRFGWLDIVVSVEKDRGFARGFEGFGINKRMKFGGYNFDGLESRGAQAVCNPFGGAVDVWLMLAFGAYGRDAQKFVELREMLLAATFYKFSKVHIRPPGARIMTQFYDITIQKYEEKRGSGLV